MHLIPYNPSRSVGRSGCFLFSLLSFGYIIILSRRLEIWCGSIGFIEKGILHAVVVFMSLCLACVSFELNWIRTLFVVYLFFIHTWLRLRFLHIINHFGFMQVSKFFYLFMIPICVLSPCRCAEFALVWTSWSVGNFVWWAKLSVTTNLYLHYMVLTETGAQRPRCLVDVVSSLSMESLACYYRLLISKIAHDYPHYWIGCRWGGWDGLDCGSVTEVAAIQVGLSFVRDCYIGVMAHLLFSLSVSLARFVVDGVMFIFHSTWLIEFW